MTDKITREDFAKLAAPFAAKDHEFNRGFIYIEETAVCARIEEVDLSFQWETMPMTPAENGIVTVVGALTIKGVTRYGTGQQVIQFDKNERETVGEARKGATTDALKRAARLFGIGRYLLDCPKEVKGYGRELDAWLRDVAKAQGLPASSQSAAPAPIPSKASDAPAEYNANLLRRNDATRWGKLLEWADKNFSMGQDDIEKALWRIEQKPFNAGDSEQVMGAILAAHCDYDSESIEKRSEGKGFKPNVLAHAALISDRIPY